MDKIICIGKNYLEHAKELGDVIPEKPVLFLKPPSTVLVSNHNGQEVIAEMPHGRGSLHHECEVVVKLKRGGKFTSAEEALSAIDSMTLGLDMTLRELQATLKKNGHPWEIGKVFRHSAIVGPFVSAADSRLKDYLAIPFSFSIDGTIKQKGTAKEMRLSIGECIVYASEYFDLCEGDLIFTGTPAGVGPVEAGQIGELRWGEFLNYKVRWI